MSDLEERYKTCGRCIHDGESNPNCEDYLIDCTHSFDTRRHLINSIDYICPKIRPCSISCNGDFMIDDEPCTSCDVYHKFKNKEVEE